MPKTKWESVIFTAYKFFDSKELLFFAVLEDIHTEGFAVAQHSLQGNTALPPAERAAAAILAACRWLSATRALVFMENDAEFLLPSHGPVFKRDNKIIQKAIDRLSEYQYMADFGTCAVSWPLLDEWEKEVSAGRMPKFTK